MPLRRMKSYFLGGVVAWAAMAVAPLPHPRGGRVAQSAVRAGRGMGASPLPLPDAESGSSGA